MASRHQHGAASVAPTFDAPAWLAAWSDHGGVAFLAGDRLYIGRAPAIDREAHQRLNTMRDAMLRQQAGQALAAYLLARSHGEAR